MIRNIHGLGKDQNSFAVGMEQKYSVSSMISNPLRECAKSLVINITYTSRMIVPLVRAIPCGTLLHDDCVFPKTGSRSCKR